MDLQTHEIHGREFQSEPLDFDAAFSLGVKLASLLGASDIRSIADILGAFKGNGEAAVAAALLTLPSAILGAGPTEILGAVLARTFWVASGKRRCLRDSAARNDAFGRDFLLAAKVVRLALETNYLDSLRAIAEALPPQSPEQPSEPQTESRIGEAAR